MRQQDPEPNLQTHVGDRVARPISGWPLATLVRLDREGARGLVGDLTLAGALSRQAAFTAVACTDLAAPAAFLTRLGIETPGAEGVGIALRARSAREIVAACFALPPREVPTGYLRALARIQEIGCEEAGVDPFTAPGAYRRLFEILAGDRHGPRAQALRYTTCLRSSTIRAVLALDPLLLCPEVLAVTGTRRQVRAANTLLDLIRRCHTRIDDAALRAALRQSVGSLGMMESFARNALRDADRLPTPLPAAPGIRPLRTTADYEEIGKRLSNCAATKIHEVALGLLAVCEVVHRDEAGAETVLAVSLTPTVEGGWIVAEIGGERNRRPPKAVMQDVVERFRALGAIIPGPAPDVGYRSELASLLGVYRWSAFDSLLDLDAEAENDELSALEGGIAQAA